MFSPKNGGQTKHAWCSCSKVIFKALCLILMFILSHVLENKLFYVSVVLVNLIRVILPQTSFELHVHVVCSPFLLRAYFIKAFKT